MLAVVIEEDVKNTSIDMKELQKREVGDELAIEETLAIPHVLSGDCGAEMRYSEPLR